MSANDNLCLKALACAGIGIEHLPYYYIREELEAQNLVEVLPQYAPPPIPINIVHHYCRQVRPTLRAFVNLLQMIYVAVLSVIQPSQKQLVRCQKKLIYEFTA